MALRAVEALEYGKRAIGNPIGSPVIGPHLLNRAGEWLVSSKSWKFLEGASATLNTTASTSYINLPSGFAALLAYQATSSLLDALEPTTFQTLQNMRSNSVSVDSGVYFFAISHAQAGAGLGAPTPRIELYPTPASTTANFFTIWYRSGWATISDDGDLVCIPTWVESLYLEAVATFAMGAAERDVATLDARLAALRMGELYRSASLRDGMVQPSYGIGTGGAVSEPSYAPDFLRSTVAAPS